MKKRIAVILTSLMFSTFMMGFLSGCSGNQTNYTLPNVKEGDYFEVTLEASGSPYSWKYEIKPKSGIEYVSMQFIPTDNDPEKIGGGQLVYTFKALSSGDYKIKFDYQISWTTDPPIKTNMYSIFVEKN